MREFSKRIRIVICFAVMAATIAEAANTVPTKLPRPDEKEPAKDKPVKVYILSGQSNMVGFGRYSGAKPAYASIFLSADPSVRPCKMPVGSSGLLPFHVFMGAKGDEKGAKALIYKGAYDANANYSRMKPEKEAAFALGTVKDDIPSMEGEHTVVAKAFIEVPMTGTHHVHAGYKDSSCAVVQLDGKEVYRKEDGVEPVITPVNLEAGRRYPVTITYMKGGSASFWMQLTGLEGKGDLKTCISEGKFGWFVDEDGKWSVRNDAVYWDVRTSKEEIGSGGPLTTTSNGKFIGPEVPFGYVMGTFHDEPVLLIESSMGNRALCFDFRPPSSGREDADNKFEGLEYRMMVDGVRKALKNIDKIVPDYADQGYDIAGFVWWQGHKDAGRTKEEYEKNLVNLIQDLRKDLDAPNMLVAVASVGFHGWQLPEKWQGVYEAQMAVGDPGQHPEFEGQVTSVDTRGFWRPRSESPTGTDYHYNHNAETYVLVGDALGRAMVEMLGGKAQPGPVPPRPDTGSSQDKSVNDMTLGEMAELVQSDAFLSTYAHDDREPTAEQIAAMGSALKPIILDRMLPAYIEELAEKNDPSILTLIKQEKVRGYRPGIRNAYDGVISRYNAAGIHEYDWQRFGPEMQHATWNYISFDPPEKQPLEQSDRLREITLPKGSENWNAPDFNPEKAGWKKGPAPFGQKDGKKLPQRPYCKDPDCGCGEVPGTLWEKEVLLMQQTFDIPELREGHRYRLVVGGNKHSRTGEGLQIYVNGKKMVETKGGSFRHAETRGAYVLSDFLPELKSGKVTIAVKSFLRYTYFRNKTTYWDKRDKEWAGKPVPPNGNISLWLEEAKLPEAVLDLSLPAEN